MFVYALCAVTQALFDGQGCHRKGNKSGLVKRLGVVDISPKSADTIIVDVSQLFYRNICPHGGSPSELVPSTEERLSQYPEATKKSAVFDTYQSISTKDHKRMRRAGEIVIDNDLSIASHLP